MRNKHLDAFAVLGVPASASLADVKRAYRKLVAVWHPDRFARDPQRQSQAQERLKEINAAYAECLQCIAERGRARAVATPVARGGGATAQPDARQAEPRRATPEVVPVPQWPNLALGGVLVVGWMVALRRYGLTVAFIQFMGLLALVPGIAAFWYNARLLRGRVMLVIYLLTVAGAGLYLVVDQALYEQRLFTALPAATGDRDDVRTYVGGGGSMDSAPYSLSPLPGPVRQFGPAAPVSPVTSAPAAPLAPIVPAAPLAPRAK